MKDFSVELSQIGKRFGREWIFRGFSATFNKQNPSAIVGRNGSGKSTFLKSLIGYLPLSEGSVAFKHQNTSIPKENWYQYLSWAAPYTELIEEFTLLEQLEFHQRFKKFLYPTELIIDKIALANAKHKAISYFSSGMKQKLKLALAMYSTTPLLLLDEPTSNLDKQNIAWYTSEMREALAYKTIIIASNQTYEYQFCSQIIDIQDLKP